MSAKEKEWDGTSERRLQSSDLIKNIAVLSERIGNLIDVFEKHSLSDEKIFEAHGNRITKLENWHMKVVGGLAIASILIQLVFNAHWSIQKLPKPVIQIDQVQAAQVDK